MQISTLQGLSAAHRPLALLRRRVFTPKSLSCPAFAMIICPLTTWTLFARNASKSGLLVSMPSIASSDFLAWLSSIDKSIGAFAQICKRDRKILENLRKSFAQSRAILLTCLKRSQGASLLMMPLLSLYARASTKGSPNKKPSQGLVFRPRRSMSFIGSSNRVRPRHRRPHDRRHVRPQGPHSAC